MGGEADGDVKRDLLGRARCLVFPVRRDEPFGLVMVEAMACGTPVVALAAGTVPRARDANLAQSPRELGAPAAR